MKAQFALGSKIVGLVMRVGVFSRVDLESNDVLDDP